MINKFRDDWCKAKFRMLTVAMLISMGLGTLQNIQGTAVAVPLI